MKKRDRQQDLKTRGKKKKHYFLQDLKRNWLLWLMLVPMFAYFIINSYLPMVGIYFAFTDYNFKDGLFGSPFIGLKNFEYLWASNTLGRLTINTILYNIAFIVLGNVLQIFMAILISQLAGKWFKKITQTMMFMPYFVSYVILSVVVYNFLNYEYGWINHFLQSIGVEPVNFYGEPNYWPFIITFFEIWKGLGYGMVVYLATILGISKELYEAATVDGANIFQQIRYILLPHVKPTFIILLLYAIGSIMKGQFQLFYQTVGNNGLLFRTTDIIDTYVYRVTTTTFDFGIGTAAGLYQSVFGFILVVVVNWLVKRKNTEYALF